MNIRLERISCINGKSNYKSGLAASFDNRRIKDADQEIKMALGYAQKQTNPLAVMALETKYASSLLHEQQIMREWDAICRSQNKKRSPHQCAIDRVAGSLAIRRHAGMAYPQLSTKHYAWLLCLRTDTLEAHIKGCERWLSDLAAPAERAFLQASHAD